MNSDSASPANAWPDPGKHAPEGFREEPADPDRTTPRGEPVELVFRPDEQPSIENDEYDVRVLVLQTPTLYLTEIVLESQKNDGSMVEKAYAAGKSRRLGDQMKSGDAPDLTAKLGEDAVQIVGDYMLAAGAMCGTLAIGEAAGGMDVMEAFQDGQITAEEFMHEFERQFRK